MENNNSKLNIPFHDEVCEFTKTEDYIASINGLVDGISVLENNKFEQPALQTDVLYNDKEPFDLNLPELYREEGYSVSDYLIQDFGEVANLTSICDANEDTIPVLETFSLKDVLIGSKEAS